MPITKRENCRENGSPNRPVDLDVMQRELARNKILPTLKRGGFSPEELTGMVLFLGLAFFALLGNVLNFLKNGDN